MGHFSPVDNLPQETFIVHIKEDGMMKMKQLLTALVLVVLPMTVLAAEGIREGQWEITSTMEVPGMPMAMPPTTVKHCYTKEDVKDQKKMISREKDCTVTDFKHSGNKVTWKMKCTGKHAGVFSGETVFSGDSYESLMHMQSDAGDSGSMSIKVKGKRIGNCQ
jgi:hypothetical protein